jgi:glycine cleavage system aminomethyltransferase T
LRWQNDSKFFRIFIFKQKTAYEIQFGDWSSDVCSSDLSVDGAIAMGYVANAHAAPGSAIGLVVRAATRPARIVPLPFIPHRYHQRKA